ncbi:MAG: AraC family transcriptional regulator [Candidatus Izemoplasmatales bacterium]|nr:AraC family transcriptional regulator [Candidatus Izemoplasmatales bacterium]
MKSEKIVMVKQIQRYVHQNIQVPLTLQEISNHIHYSPWYTARIFHEVMGLSLFEYIRRLRLTQAAKVLRDSNRKVIDVAFDFVFDSHEGFSRAFSKEFHLSPKRYQQAPIPLPYFIPFEAMEYPKKGEESKMENKAVFVQIIERPQRKAIIRRAKTANEYFQYCEEVGCDIWGVFCSVKEAISEPVGMWLSDELKTPNTSTYVQGVEVPLDYQGIIPVDCELIDLPECLMMMFQGEPYDDENFQEEVGQVMQFVSRYNPEVIGYTYDPKGYRFQYEPQGYRGYIEGRTVIKL